MHTVARSLRQVAWGKKAVRAHGTLELMKDSFSVRASTTPTSSEETVFGQPRPQFYEGKWADPDLSDGSLRNWLVRKQRFFLRRLPRSSQHRVLDLGCGGGWKLFTRAGRVAGVDYSRQSLKAASAIYAHGAMADLAHLPFRADAFDTVVSADVLGHIPLHQKQQVVEEIHRVLKTGGRTLHFIEAEGDDPIIRFAKQDPELYQRRIIGPEGHEGIESAADTFARFRRAGFQPLAETGAYRMIMYVGRVPQLFDNEYARRSGPLGALVALCKLLTRWRPLELASNIAVALLLEITDRVFPERWSGGVLVDYVKEAA